MLAHQRVDLPLVQIEVHSLQRRYAVVVDVDTAHPKEVPVCDGANGDRFLVVQGLGSVCAHSRFSLFILL